MKRLATLLVATMTIFAVSAQPKIIAHRGFHAADGAARNSLNALREAQNAGLFGSECDIRVVGDGEILVLHGSMHPDKPLKGLVSTIHGTTAELQAIKLESGETVPTFDEYLAQAKKNTNTKLIIEMKDGVSPAEETKFVKRVVKMVKKYGLQNDVEYIAFRAHICAELARYAPKGTQIAFLNGNYTPSYCKAMGCTGIDYNYKVLQRKPHWIKEAHDLGMTVNAWTVDKESDIRWCIDNGVDYITTDDPMLVKRLIDEKFKK